MQELRELSGNETVQEPTGLKDRIKKLKDNKVETMREVSLRLMVGCGCGFDEVEVRRVVPQDSELQDGDVIYKYDLLDSDKVVE